jgi:hypothetical protein
MDNNVPTAEDFFLKRSKELHSDPEDMPGWMIEEAKNLAKLHVEAALKSAAKNGRIESYRTNAFLPSRKRVESSSILNAYPDTNIR